MSVDGWRWAAGRLIYFVDCCFRTLSCLAFAITSFIRPLMKDICTLLIMVVVIEDLFFGIFNFGL